MHSACRPIIARGSCPVQPIGAIRDPRRRPGPPYHHPPWMTDRLPRPWPSTSPPTARPGIDGRPTSSPEAGAPGPSPSRPGGSGMCPNPSWACSPTILPAAMRSSWAAGPPTCRPGSPAWGRGPSGSTTRRTSSRPPGGSRTVRTALPAGPRRRRAHAVPGRELRPRDLRVRRRDLVRPVRLDPGGGADPAAGRAAGVPGALGARDARSPEGDEVLPVEARLIRPQFGMHRFDWSDASSKSPTER